MRCQCIATDEALSIHIVWPYQMQGHAYAKQSSMETSMGKPPSIYYLTLHWTGIAGTIVPAGLQILLIVMCAFTGVVRFL